MAGYARQARPGLHTAQTGWLGSPLVGSKASMSEAPSSIGDDMPESRPFQLISDFSPSGDQPGAIDALTEGVLRGDPYQTLLGVTGTGKTFTMAGVDPTGAEAHAGHRPEQVPGRPAGAGVPGVLPQQRGRVLRLLLRLLPARGIRPADGHLHREGLVHQRRDRAPPALGHLGAADAAGRDHRGLGVLHLRPGLARRVRGPAPAGAPGRGHRPGLRHPPADRHPVRAQRGEPHPGQVPGEGRHARDHARVRAELGPHRMVGRLDRTHRS